MKKTIEEQLRDMSYDSIRQVADGFELDNDSKQRIYFKTLRHAGLKGTETAVSTRSKEKNNPIIRKIHFKKPVVATAAVVLALSIGVGSIAAAGALNKSFTQIFHSLPESNYKDIIFNIGQSKTDNGVTVTLTQGMCDGTALYVIEKVEFDPSIITLTDEMFNTTDRNYSEPFFGTEDVRHSNSKSITVERGFSKLLEHDEHSITYLKAFGGNTSLENTSNFFTNDTKLLLINSGIQNLAGYGDKSYECRFEFEFEIKLCEPTVYNLPKNTYHYDESIRYAGYDNYPDVWVNPWYMQIAPACTTGKVIDSGLADDKPAIEITLNDGTVYTDKKGILVGGNPFKTQDLLGSDYDLYNDIYCTFDTEVDVTNIKSIKLYGKEMTKATVPEPKPVEKRSSIKLELPATNPISFSKTERKFDVTEFKSYQDPKKGSVKEEIPAGSMKYKIKNIGVYDNLYATGAKQEDILKIAIEDGKFLYYDENGVIYGKGFGDACDIKTGKLSDKFYLVEYEIELTNIDSYLSEFQQEFFKMNVYCNYSDIPNEVDSTIIVPTVYIKENNREANGSNNTFTIKKGQTRSLHIGFIVNDNYRGSLEQLGIRVGDEQSPAFVNITKAVEELNKTK